MGTVLKSIKEKLFGKSLSKYTAKNRLQMVLVQDRSGLTQQDMDLFKRDLLEVITRYFVLERNALEVEWKRSNSSTALIINTPVSGRPREASRAVAN